MKKDGLIAGYRITRRKLGPGPKELPEFNVMVEFEDLARIDQDFGQPPKV